MIKMITMALAATALVAFPATANAKDRHGHRDRDHSYRTSNHYARPMAYRSHSYPGYGYGYRSYGYPSYSYGYSYPSSGTEAVIRRTATVTATRATATATAIARPLIMADMATTATVTATSAAIRRRARPSAALPEP